VRQKTKTYNSTRKIKVPDYIMQLIQNQRQGNDSEFIVTLSGQAIYKRLSRLLESNGIQHMRFHDLRHMNASVMLQLGVPDKYAMERGGWSTDSTLKQVYQHTFDEKRNEIDSQIDDYFNKLL
jgi:integrase